MGDTGIRVLVVDDEEELVETLRAILALRGFDVDTALSGEEAIERARQRAPQVVLVDLRMPGLSGPDAYLRIREIAPSSRAIFMTGYISPELESAAWNAGAKRVLQKPFDIEDLLSHVSAVATAEEGGET